MKIVGRSGTNRLVFVSPSEVWALEARERLVYVHATLGRLEVDVSLSELEPRLGPGFLRVHRSWLVARSKVREMRWRDGSMALFVGDCVRDKTNPRGIDVPVSRDRVTVVKQQLFAGTCGLSSRRARAGTT